MALPDSFKIASGSQSSVTWKASGGDHAITLASIAVDAARQGAKGDLGANYDKEWYAQITVNMNVAPTAGNEIELFLGFSPNATAGTDNPAALTGTDAAYTGSTAGTADNTKHQASFVGAIPLTPDADAVVQKKIFGPFVPPFRYVCPLLVNKADQAMEGDDDSHQIVLYSLAEQAQD